jgi:hypothetical protein
MKVIFILCQPEGLIIHISECICTYRSRCFRSTVILFYLPVSQEQFILSVKGNLGRMLKLNIFRTRRYNGLGSGIAWYVLAGRRSVTCELFFNPHFIILLT